MMPDVFASKANKRIDKSLKDLDLEKKKAGQGRTIKFLTVGKQQECWL